jgi:hypothetical protein
MQKNMNKVVETVLISNPEAAFEQENLTYQSGEIQEIINSFTSAADFQDIHRTVIDLLQATANFRYATVPNGIFFKLRNKNKSELELKALLVSMDKLIHSAQAKLMGKQMAMQDKTILRSALKYIARSIINRMRTLQAEDRLLPLWQQSALRDNIEGNGELG